MAERRRRSGDDGAVLKKGPWTQEEDKILMEFVGKYGAREWSSIRSKGLLPRSGKSCRLRWVNKLIPNLKTIEEQETVINLQAKFGNKWAKIATFLEGRTDNDVKNFWSTRKKRMARMQKKNEKKTNVETSQMLLLRLQKEEEGECSKTKTENEDDNYSDEDDDHLQLQGQDDDSMIAANMEEQPLLLDPSPLQHLRQEDYEHNIINDDSQIDGKMEFPQIPQFNLPPFPQSLLEFPAVPDNMDLMFNDDYPIIFPRTEPASGHDDLHLFGLPMMGLEGQKLHNGDGDAIPSTPENFFDDFPVDLLEYPEPPPPPPPSSGDS